MDFTRISENDCIPAIITWDVGSCWGVEALFNPIILLPIAKLNYRPVYQEVGISEKQREQKFPMNIDSLLKFIFQYDRSIEQELFSKT